MDRTFVDRLDQLGFFKYIDSAQREDAKRQGAAAIYGETGRLFHADAESLAEGGVGDFLREMEPFLRKQGVTISQIEDQFRDYDYSVTINGMDYIIYSADELELHGQRVVSIWGLATVRSFAIVNELLANAESNERLYAVNGGNDLFGFFSHT